MWIKERFFKVSTAILISLVILALIIYLLPYLLHSLDFIVTLLYPVMITLIFYYLLRPIRNHLEKRKLPRSISLSLLFLLLAIFLIILGSNVWPVINSQIVEFSNFPEAKIEEIQNKAVETMNFFNVFSVSKEELRNNLIFYINGLLKLISTNLISTVSSLAKVASFFIITPFLLFYLLKDDTKIIPYFANFFSKRYSKDILRMGNDVDEVLSCYITGQFMVATIVGILIFIGYNLIGLNYTITLAFFAFIFNMIPFTGPFISTIPALFVGLSISPSMGLKVILVVITIHLLDANLISPRIVGQQLNIHPVTVIFLLVIGLSLFGFIGLFIATPLYAVVKNIIKNLILLRKHKKVEI